MKLDSSVPASPAKVPECAGFAGESSLDGFQLPS
jgi:hypothetical protein